MSGPAVDVLELARAEVAKLSPSGRCAFFAALADGYCTACGEALQVRDCGPLGKLPEVCHCEDDT